MSLSGRLYRTDRKPLGTIEAVQECLTGYFPGMRFIKVISPNPDIETPKFSWWLRAWLSVFGEKVEYPFWEGAFEGNQFAAVFRLGPHPLVQSVRVTLYGQGTPAAAPMFDALTRQTGWQLKYY